MSGKGRGGSRVAVLLLAFLAGAGRAADPVDVALQPARGTRAAFLALVPDARQAAMGETFAAAAGDATAAAGNPAGLGSLDGFSAAASYGGLGAGIGLSQIAGATPAGPVVVGAAATALLFGAVVGRDAMGAPTGTVSENVMAGTLAVGAANAAWVGGPGWTGFSLEVVEETAAGALAGVSAGSIMPLDGGWTVGGCLQHLGSRAGGGSLPGAARAGATWMPADGVLLAFDGAWAITDRQPACAAGVEVTPLEGLALRAGYAWRPAADLAGAFGATVGFGWRAGDFGLDYAYQPFGDLATVHRFALVYRGAAPASTAR